MSVRHSNKKRKNVARSRVSRLLQTVSWYISRDKYRDTSMNRDDTSSYVVFVIFVQAEKRLDSIRGIVTSKIMREWFAVFTRAFY